MSSPNKAAPSKKRRPHPTTSSSSNDENTTGRGGSKNDKFGQLNMHSNTNDNTNVNNNNKKKKKKMGSRELDSLITYTNKRNYDISLPETRTRSGGKNNLTVAAVAATTSGTVTSSSPPSAVARTNLQKRPPPPASASASAVLPRGPPTKNRHQNNNNNSGNDGGGGGFQTSSNTTKITKRTRTDIPNGSMITQKSLPPSSLSSTSTSTTARSLPPSFNVDDDDDDDDRRMMVMDLEQSSFSKWNIFPTIPLVPMMMFAPKSFALPPPRSSSSSSSTSTSAQFLPPSFKDNNDDDDDRMMIMDLEQPYSSSSSASSKKPFPMIPFVPQEEECFPPHHTRTTSSNGGGAKAAAAAATAEAKSTPDPMAMMTASLSNIPMTDNDATTNTRDAGAAAASTIDNNNNKENRDPVQFINTTATKNLKKAPPSTMTPRTMTTMSSSAAAAAVTDEDQNEEVVTETSVVTDDDLQSENQRLKLRVQELTEKLEVERRQREEDATTMQQRICKLEQALELERQQQQRKEGNANANHDSAVTIVDSIQGVQPAVVASIDDKTLAKHVFSMKAMYRIVKLEGGSEEVADIVFSKAKGGIVGITKTQWNFEKQRDGDKLQYDFVEKALKHPDNDVFVVILGNDVAALYLYTKDYDVKKQRKCKQTTPNLTHMGNVVGAKNVFMWTHCRYRGCGLLNRLMKQAVEFLPNDSRLVSGNSVTNKGKLRLLKQGWEKRSKSLGQGDAGYLQIDVRTLANKLENEYEEKKNQVNIVRGMQVQLE